MKKAFTLTELIVALAVIAILSAIMMPIIHKLRPNQDVLMVKRAFNLTQTVVSEMANDARCYPQLTYSAPNGEERIFENGKGYEQCTAYSNPEDDDMHAKFRAIFADIANLTHDNGINYNSKDGMQWRFASDLGSVANNDPICNSNMWITIDTDRNNDHPHDTFSLRVCANGKIFIDEDDYDDFVNGHYNWVIETIGIDRRLVGD